MSKDIWSAQLTSFGPGTERFRIEYRSASDWNGTQLEHSFTTSRAGSTWTYRNGVLTYYDASRNLTTTTQGPAIVDNWIQPGQLQDLRASGKAHVTVLGPGRVQLELADTWVDGRGPHTRTTMVQYDERTMLPVVAEMRGDGGRLESRTTYQVLH